MTPRPRTAQEILEFVGARWVGTVVWALEPGPQRFNWLLHHIPGISDRVLTERLRALELAGFVDRDVAPGSPVRVAYRLSAAGRGLVPILDAARDWSLALERWSGKVVVR